MAKKTGGATPAIAALTRLGIKFTLHEYEHAEGATDFGDEAARELGVDASRIYKTLLTEVDSVLTVGVVPVAGTLNLKALAKARAGKRASMADPAVAEAKTGYVLGGVSPIGQRTASPTVIDESAQRFETVFVSGGKRGLDIELSPHDLARATKGEWAAIARL